MAMKEKQVLIKTNGIVLDTDQGLGRSLFAVWIDRLGELGQKYCHRFQQSYLDDMVQLVSLTSSELSELMHGWREADFVVPDNHIEFLIKEIDQERTNLIR